MSEGNDKQPPKSWIKTLNRELTIPLVMALIVIQFLVQSFKIPSGSMERSLLIGDFLLGLKFVYGAPIPFTNKRLPAIQEPKPGDVIIFRYPMDPEVPDRNPERFQLLAKILLIGDFYWDKTANHVVRYEPKDFIKRCVATSGQTVAMRGQQLMIDGKEQILPPNGHYGDRPKLAILERPRDSLGPLHLPKPGESLDLDTLSLENFIRFYGVAIQEHPEQAVRCSLWVEINGKPLADDTAYGISLPALEDRYFLRAVSFANLPYPDGQEIASISLNDFSQGLSRFHHGIEIPAGKLTQIEHIGPMPYGSSVMERALQAKYAGRDSIKMTLRKRIFLDDKWQAKYTLKEPVFLMMGDNRDNSSDGRFWGLLARRNVKARAFVLYFSFENADDGFAFTNPVSWLSIPLRIRWNRLGRLVDDP
ncbi:MAG: signal peptidase [Fibrobacterota bacterium]|jgi:signal peptidase I